MKKLTQKILSSIMGKIGVVSLMTICLTMFNSGTKAQTLLVNYDFASAVAGTPCTAAPLTTAVGVESIFTTGGTDGETCTIYEEPPTSQNKEANLAMSLSNSDDVAENYFQFQLMGVSAFRSYRLNFNAIQSGPIDVQYSLDGVNFTSFTQLPRPITQLYFPRKIVDLSAVTAIDRQPTVYFRLVGKSSPSRNLRFVIDNLQVQATAAIKSRKRVRFF
jgi:hypothetical protein